MKKYIPIALVVGLVLAVSILPACTKAEVTGEKEGALPTLSIGDKWVRRGPEGMVMTAEVTGEEVADGKNYYVVTGTSRLTTERGQIVGSSTSKIDKATMQPVSVQSQSVSISGGLEEMLSRSLITYSYEFPESLPFPLAVGKEVKMITTMTTDIKNIMGERVGTIKSASVLKVETVEAITVLAGTFRAFKIAEYDEQGNLLVTMWYSDKVKNHVKVTHKTGETFYELMSYVIH